MIVSDSPMSFDFCPSAKGLQRVAANSYPADFTFIHARKRYPVPRFVAAFLSPTISSMRYTDPTCAEFHFTRKYRPSLLSAFLSLGHGASITISPEDRVSFVDFCLELGNEDFYSTIRDREDLTPATVFGHLGERSTEFSCAAGD
jgi:hypothetical protein